MILKSVPQIPLQTVTMPGAAGAQMQMLCGPDDGCPNFAMRKFTIAPGGNTPRHQHDYEHEILILAGGGVAFGNGQEQPINAGDAIYMPANEPHQFRNTGTVPLEFICMVPAFVHKKTVDCAK